MLIEFRFKNYRSFRDEAVLSMEATGLSSFKKSLIPWSSTTKLLPSHCDLREKWRWQKAM